TLSLWFNADTIDSSYDTLFSMNHSGYGDGNTSVYVRDGSIDLYIEDDSGRHWINAGTVSTGQWHQMALTFGPDGMELYVDGTLVGTDPHTGGIGSSSLDPIVIGASTYNASAGTLDSLTNFFDGSIAEVALIGEALSASEINNLYQTGVNADQLATPTIKEGAADGAAVAMISASDPDDGETLNYSLVDDAGGRFAINSSTGEITVADGSALDHETDASHDVTVRVTDAAGSSYDETFTINVGDVNEEPVAIDLTPDVDAPNRIDVSLAGTYGGATEADIANPQYEIYADGQLIASGEVDWAAKPDWSNFDANSYQTLTVEWDNGGVAPENVWVRLTNDDAGSGGDRNLVVDYIEVNGERIESEGDDSQVRFGDGSTIDGQEGLWWDATLEFDTSSAPNPGTVYNAAVAENADGATVGSLTTNDPDSGDVISYGVSDTRFEVVAGELKLKAGQSLDFETEPTVSLDVTATDSGGLTTTETFVLAVQPINEAPTDMALADNSVDENASAQTVVGKVSTTDVDSAEDFTYSLTDDAGGRFAIDSGTGEVTVVDGDLLDFETAASHDITVQVTDSAGNSITETHSIAVTDVGEAPADITFLSTVSSTSTSVVSEDFEAGATGWSDNTTTAGGAGLDGSYLGNFGDTGGSQTIYKTFSLSGNQDSVTINFDFWEFDTWNGEDFKIWVDDQLISTDTYYTQEYYGSSDSSTYGTSTSSTSSDLGHGMYSDQTHSYSFTIDSSATSIKLGFGASLDETTSSESWGIDNLELLEVQNVTSTETIVEADASYGTVVGTVSSINDAGETPTYSLTDDAGGLFAIDSNTGEITTAAGAPVTPAYTLVTGSSSPVDGFSTDWYATPDLVDIDNDGDLDLFVGDDTGNMKFYENVGDADNPSFASAVTNPFGFSDIGTAATPAFVDIDGDGDMDAFVGNGDGDLTYYENTGSASSPTFTASGTNPFGLDNVGDFANIDFADVDGDGDMDAFVGESNGTVNYFENTGTASSATFASDVSDPFGISDQG
ncbi:MAG: cadherin domain-containing protein, partial [Geminicoccaceae bacterium]